VVIVLRKQKGTKRKKWKEKRKRRGKERGSGGKGRTGKRKKTADPQYVLSSAASAK